MERRLQVRRLVLVLCSILRGGSSRRSRIRRWPRLPVFYQYRLTVAAEIVMRSGEQFLDRCLHRLPSPRRRSEKGMATMATVMATAAITETATEAMMKIRVPTYMSIIIPSFGTFFENAALPICVRRGRRYQLTTAATMARLYRPLHPTLPPAHPQKLPQPQHP